MSTNSNIGYQHKDGAVTVVYCHFDGYLDGVGQDLLDMTYYDAVEMVDQGDMSYVGEPYTERGESFEDNKPEQYDSLEHAKTACEGPYLYICQLDGQWIVSVFGEPFENLEDATEE